MAEKKKEVNSVHSARVDLACIYMPGRKEGNSLVMTMGGGDIKSKETGELLGSLENVVPIGLCFKSAKTERTYILRVDSIIAAFVEADSEEPQS